MGIVNNVTHSQYPDQSDYLGKTVAVTFNYDTENTIYGIIVRDDMTEPYRTLIALTDGRFILGTECQWREIMPEEQNQRIHQVLYTFKEGEVESSEHRGQPE